MAAGWLRYCLGFRWYLPAVRLGCRTAVRYRRFPMAGGGYLSVVRLGCRTAPVLSLASPEKSGLSVCCATALSHCDRMSTVIGGWRGLSSLLCDPAIARQAGFIALPVF